MLYYSFFGRLPKETESFLLTVKWNPGFDWLLLTDDKTELDYPANVRVVYSSFEELKELIQSKYNFEISLVRPRKLCDFRPAYGYIFEEYLEGYEYWGYCDLDQYFGDLSKWLKDDYMTNFDRMFALGHMTIYRNQAEINRLYMSEDEREDVILKNYKQVFQYENGLS